MAGQRPSHAGRVDHGMESDRVARALQHLASRREKLGGRLPLGQARQGSVTDVLELALSSSLIAQGDLRGPDGQGAIGRPNQVALQPQQDEGPERGQDDRQQQDVPDRQPDPDGNAHPSSRT